jgi:hypothetical protein
MAKLGRFSALHQPAARVTKRKILSVVVAPTGNTIFPTGGINSLQSTTYGNAISPYPANTNYLQFGVNSELPVPTNVTAIPIGATVQAYDESNVLAGTATTFGAAFWYASGGSYLIPVTWAGGGNGPYLGMFSGTKFIWTA